MCPTEAWRFLPTPESLRDAAIQFLLEGDEDEEARLLSACTIQLGALRCLDEPNHEIAITLRCNRAVMARLRSPHNAKEPSLSMQRISAAIADSLPCEFQIGKIEARAGGPKVGIVPPSGLAPPKPLPTSTSVSLDQATLCSICKIETSWEVVFEGSPAIHLRDTLGVRYLDHLLRHPHEVISAYDLEILIDPEKGEARLQDSIQSQLDPDSIKSCLAELDRLRELKDQATEANKRVEVDQLDAEIETITGHLSGSACAADNGERARNNVRKAVNRVHGQLLKGGKHAKAFSKHTRQHVSLGYKCSYAQPQGTSWDG